VAQQFTTYDGVTNEALIFTDRSRTFKGIDGIAQGESSIATVGERLRLSYSGKLGFGCAKPSIDIDAIQIMTNGYAETGAGRANMTFPGTINTSYSLTPMLGFGARCELNPVTPGTGFLRLGAIVSPQNVWIVQTEFAAAPPGAGVVSLHENFDNVVGKIFPDEAAIVRLVGALRLEPNDERSVRQRYMGPETRATVVNTADVRLTAIPGT